MPSGALTLGWTPRTGSADWTEGSRTAQRVARSSGGRLQRSCTAPRVTSVRVSAAKSRDGSSWLQAPESWAARKADSLARTARHIVTASAVRSTSEDAIARSPDRCDARSTPGCMPVANVSSNLAVDPEIAADNQKPAGSIHHPRVAVPSRSDAASRARRTTPVTGSSATTPEASTCSVWSARRTSIGSQFACGLPNRIANASSRCPLTKPRARLESRASPSLDPSTPETLRAEVSARELRARRTPSPVHGSSMAQGTSGRSW